MLLQKRKGEQTLLFGFLLLWREQAEAWSPRVCLVVEQHTWFGIVGLVCCPLTPVCREGSTELAIKKNYSCKTLIQL